VISAVVVDVDDTLVLTEAVCFEIENAALAKLDRPPMTRAVHIATWGQPLLDAIRLRSPGVDVTRSTPRSANCTPATSPAGWSMWSPRRTTALDERAGARGAGSCC
jgi:hypothetical protein